MKSPNLLIDKHWTCKIGDFGLGRKKRGESYYVSDGCGGVGTPEWTAPEVLKGDPFNEFADVYSYGVIVWELLSRQKPWKGLSQVHDDARAPTMYVNISPAWFLNYLSIHRYKLLWLSG